MWHSVRRLRCWNDTVDSFVTFNFNKRIRAAKFICKCAFNSTLKIQGFYTQRHIKQLLISCMIMWLSSSGPLRRTQPPSVLFPRTSRTAAVLYFLLFHFLIWLLSLPLYRQFPCERKEKKNICALTLKCMHGHLHTQAYMHTVKTKSHYYTWTGSIVYASMP